MVSASRRHHSAADQRVGQARLPGDVTEDAEALGHTLHVPAVLVQEMVQAMNLEHRAAADPQVGRVFHGGGPLAAGAFPVVVRLQIEGRVVDEFERELQPVAVGRGEELPQPGVERVRGPLLWGPARRIPEDLEEVHAVVRRRGDLAVHRLLLVVFSQQGHARRPVLSPVPAIHHPLVRRLRATTRRSSKRRQDIRAPPRTTRQGGQEDNKRRRGPRAFISESSARRRWRCSSAAVACSRRAADSSCCAPAS